MNLCGYVSAESGLGEAARSGIRALQAAGIPFVVNEITLQDMQNREAPREPVSPDNPYAVNWICTNIAEADLAAWQLGQEYFRGHYNIGYWVWEMTEFPSEWLANFKYYDEIWTPSNFVRDTIARVSPVPVQVVPYAIGDMSSEPSQLQRSDLGLAEHSFIFLFIFHHYSLFERKNPLRLVEAFKLAFPDQIDVTLLIKSAGGAGTVGHEALKRAAQSANVLVLDEVMTRADLNKLYTLCDCYVSLHRAEGFGLTIAEAMAAGKPVIATAYSGNTDFATPENSYPVRASLTEMSASFGPYQKGWTWAEPDIEHAASLMREVYDNREMAATKGAQGRRDILRHCGEDRVGELIRQRLKTITEK